MTINNFELISTIVNCLRAGGMDIWVFGGWAEELQGMRPPGLHTDVDLLLRAPDFGLLDAFARAGNKVPPQVARSVERFATEQQHARIG